MKLVFGTNIPFSHISIVRLLQHRYYIYTCIYEFTHHVGWTSFKVGIMSSIMLISFLFSDDISKMSLLKF